MAAIEQRTTDKALEILDGNPDGVRYSESVRRIGAADTSLNINSVYITVSYLPANCPDHVYRPSRGLYRLTKTYLVVSEKSPDDEIARLDALCQVFGIGLVLFDSENPSDPKFTIRCRLRYQQPDLFYANRYMKLIEAEMFS